MKEYLSSIIIISIGVTLFELLAPSNESLLKYIRLIGALCMVCVIIAPLNVIGETLSDNLLDDLKDNLTDNSKEDLKDQYKNMLNEYLNSYSVDSFNNQIESLLEENFGIPKSECEVNTYTTFENGKLAITEIQVLLSGNSIFQNPYTIEKYISNICTAECKVLIK